MEIFAIIVLLTIRIFWQAPVFQAFLITGIVAVACGYAGDLMNDYKTGRLIGTSPKSQLISEIIGGVLGAVVAVFGLFAIIISYGGVGGDTGLTAAQAHTVTAMIDGIAEVPAFSIALVLGLVLYLAKIPSMIVGIGMLLPFSMSTTVFLGGLAQLLVTKLSKKRANGEELGLKGQLLAAGLLGGEGIVGTVLAIIAMIKG